MQTQTIRAEFKPTTNFHRDFLHGLRNDPALEPEHREVGEALAKLLEDDGSLTHRPKPQQLAAHLSADTTLSLTDVEVYTPTVIDRHFWQPWGKGPYVWANVTRFNPSDWACAAVGAAIPGNMLHLLCMMTITDNFRIDASGRVDTDLSEDWTAWRERLLRRCRGLDDPEEGALWDRSFQEAVWRGWLTFRDDNGRRELYATYGR